MNEREITKEELNKKSDWVVTGLNHYKYNFDISTFIYKNKTIREILDEKMMLEFEDRIERAGYKGYAYAIDEIYHEDKESDTWCLTEQEKERFRPLHIECILFAELDKFIENEGFTWSFGDTNRKYGVMDYAYKPYTMLEMSKEEQSNKQLYEDK